MSTSEPRNEEKDKEDNHPKDEKHSDDKPPSVLPTAAEEQVPIEERVSSEWMRNETILVNNRDKKLELLLTSLSANVSASMILKDDRARAFFTASDVKYLRSIVYMMEIVFKLRFVLS